MRGSWQQLKLIMIAHSRDLRRNGSGVPESVCFSANVLDTAPLRHLLRRVLHSQNFDSARLVQHSVRDDVVPMRDQLAQGGRQAGPASTAKLWMLREQQCFVAQIFAEFFGLDRVAVGNEINDVIQVSCHPW